MNVVIDGVMYEPIRDTNINSEYERALEIRFDSDVGENITLRTYLHELLSVLIDQGENFNSKRPYGNSGWQYEIYTQLIKHKFINGYLDSDGYVREVDNLEARHYILLLINQIFFGTV